MTPAIQMPSFPPTPSLPCPFKKTSLHPTTATTVPSQDNDRYVAATGGPPMTPECGLGFWQGRLCAVPDAGPSRRSSRSRASAPGGGSPSTCPLVVDFSHWRAEGGRGGELRPRVPTCRTYPAAMCEELRELGVEPMVSIWPTVEPGSDNRDGMMGKGGYLIRTERGAGVAMDFRANTVHSDATSPAARECVWNKAEENCGQCGIRLFWLDEAESGLDEEDRVLPVRCSAEGDGRRQGF